IIGGGIFRTPATVAQRVGSPTLVLTAWIVGGVVALIGAFCFGELGHRRPKAGGGYVYLRETWGPLAGFLYGWALLLVIATGAIAVVAVAAVVAAIGAALVPILFTYGGWQQTNFIAEEIVEPEKNLPRALVLGVAVVVAVYLLANVAYLRVLGPAQLAASTAPAADV